MTAFNDTVASAYDLGSISVGYHTTVNLDPPNIWDTDAGEIPYQPPDVWFKMSIAEPLWLAFRYHWKSGGVDDASTHGWIFTYLFRPNVPSPGSVSDLTYAGGGAFRPSGGSPAAVAEGEVYGPGGASLGVYYRGVSGGDVDVQAAAAAGLALSLELQAYSVLPPTLSLSAAATTDIRHMALTMTTESALPGVTSDSIQLAVDWGDGNVGSTFGNEPSAILNHRYFLSLPRTITVVATDPYSGLTTTRSIIYPTPILPALPDEAFSAEVRSEARLQPRLHIPREHA